MNNPDHISESLETIIWAKILKCFDEDPGSAIRDGKIMIRDGKNSDPGSKMEKIRIRDVYPGSATLHTLRYLEGALKLEDLSDEPSLLLLLFRRELRIKTLLAPLNAFIRHSWRI